MSFASWRRSAAVLATPVVIAFVVGGIAAANAARPSVATEWRAAGDLAVPRAYSSATVLPDGSVLVVGGFLPDGTNTPSTRAELYDPIADRSVVLPQVLLGRVYHTATRVGELVVVTGGNEQRGDAMSAIDRTDVYDVRTRTWRTASPLHEARANAGATALRDGRVLVTGGNDGPRMRKTTEIFDPATGSWTMAAPLPAARTQFSIATLPDGRVLVAGGLVFPGAPSATSLLYDPDADAWTAGPRMSIERVLHTDAQLADGRVVLVGGQNAAGGTSEIFDPRTNTFQVLATLAQPRMLAQAVALADGGLIVTGGISPQRDQSEFRPWRSAERYDPATRVFSLIPSPRDARAFAKLALLGADVYQIGGISDGEKGTRTIEVLGWR